MKTLFATFALAAALGAQTINVQQNGYSIQASDINGFQTINVQQNGYSIQASDIPTTNGFNSRIAGCVPDADHAVNSVAVTIIYNQGGASAYQTIVFPALPATPSVPLSCFQGPSTIHVADMQSILVATNPVSIKIQ